LRIGLARGEKRRADIGKVGAHRFGREDAAPVRDAARQEQQPVPPFTDLADERERRLVAGVTAGAGGDRDDAVDPHFGAFLGVAVADDVLEDEAAVGLQLAHKPGVRGERQHDDRDLVLQDDIEIGGEPLVALVRDEIDAPGLRADACRNAREILVERFGAPRIERGHRADDSGVALRDDEIGRRGEEHRPRHDREAEAGFEPGGEADIRHAAPRQAIRPSSRTRRSPTWARKAAPSASGQMLNASLSPG
jgi:hypothetical protein